MSGGSYNYLFRVEVCDLMNSIDALESMAERLSGLGYAKDVAAETTNLLISLRSFEIRAEAMRGRLASVWKAMEWWDSNDTSEDEFKEALQGFRDTNEGKEKQKT